MKVILIELSYFFMDIEFVETKIFKIYLIQSPLIFTHLINWEELMKIKHKK